MSSPPGLTAYDRLPPEQQCQVDYIARAGNYLGGRSGSPAPLPESAIPAQREIEARYYSGGSRGDHFRATVDLLASRQPTPAAQETVRRQGYDALADTASGKVVDQPPATLQEPGDARKLGQDYQANRIAIEADASSPGALIRPDGPSRPRECGLGMS